MQRVSVSSSNIDSVGYDSTTHVLEVQFHGGQVFRYSNVPDGLYTQLLASSSVGGYFHKYVRGKYPYAKVEQEAAMTTAVAAEQPSHHTHLYKEFVAKVILLKDDALAHAQHPSPYSERWAFWGELLEESLAEAQIRDEDR